MTNRGCILLLLFLSLVASATSVSAQTVALQVRVYDYSGLSAAALRVFISNTQRILTEAGISVEVDACPKVVATPCDSRQGSSRQVAIRVVAAAPRSGRNARWQHLGRSIADHDGGTYATVFLDLVQDEAANTDLPRMLVLAYAAAHEVGHLLLGDDAHTAEGLMQAHWKNEDFQAMAQNRFQFSPQQAEELKRRYGTGRSIDMSAHTSTVARH
jgi:hypothetical protein